MSWSFQVRVLGLCGVWLAVQTGCGGNPEVSSVDPGMNGGGTSGANGATGGTAGTLMIGMGGDDNGEGGGGETPTEYVCGNQELEPGEFCDDGNTADDDGCSGDCTEVDLDYDCSTVGEPCVKVVICGNGVLEGAELCDDLNTVDADGCSADCSVVEDGWVCVRPGTRCVAVSVCGNGVRERGEECDAPGDGCDDQCQLEDGYYCPTPGEACVPLVCGNGVRTPDEACDDNDAESGDGCSSLCTIEDGFRCNTNGCQPICGDGLVMMGEGCDDGDRDSSDGCSAACTEEPFFDCTGQPSVCTTTIACGNQVIEPGEICDPPGMNGCSPGCTSFNPDTTDPAVCGNDVIEEGETCDPPNGNMGCSNACAVQNGWTCPQAGVCFRNPYCGDSIVQGQEGEECDPPNVGNGCSATCQEENGWTCVGLGPSVCVNPDCGNGIVEAPSETCDDGTPTGTQDGCPSSCQIVTGWACPVQGMPCIPKCGDGLLLGVEECDDGNRTNLDGCNAACRVEPGFTCPTPDTSCSPAVCGDANLDEGEGCDDGGVCIGGTNDGDPCDAPADCPGATAVCRPVAGDGCGGTCQLEPAVTVGPNPVVDTPCGDGFVTSEEDCDDGNLDDNDGCSSICEVDPRFTCMPRENRPQFVEMTVRYRDFIARAATGGHPDFQWEPNPSYLGMPGPVCTRDDHDLCESAAGAVCGTDECGYLDDEGKPVYHRINNQGRITSADTFGLWYRDENTASIAGQNGVIEVDPIPDTLTLGQIGGANSDVYQYSSTTHFPLNGIGFGASCDEVNPSCCTGSCAGRNFHFTTELRYFFQYSGGETLTFYGDDDVWVFINGRLAVDIGGVHGQQYGRVVLGDDGLIGATNSGTDSNCSVHGGGSLPALGTCYTNTGGPANTGEQGDADDTRFGLTKGGVYEIVLFHAERHTTASNFQLTLDGFLPSSSNCTPICGDGIIAPGEVCDDGDDNEDNVSGRCNSTCTAISYCGDGVEQMGEECDNGTNLDLYRTSMSPATACAPGCQDPAACGDGTLQPAYEQCDKGAQNNDASYGPTSCKTNCQLGGFCGDGTTNGNEVCDLGASNGTGYGPSSCAFNCQPGPRCGDDIRNGSEQCDDGADNGSATSNCTNTCTIKPYCGDGIKQMTEQCDYGQFASINYGGCTDMCMNGPSCGDGMADDPYEECDEGTVNNTGGYDGCTNKCDLGPHCGDAVLQAGDGESCDNGFNDDDYRYDTMSCALGCTLPPYCGDALVQASHELCDEGASNDDDTYEGCTTTCEFGPFCGDGTIDPSELCDDGLDNVSYEPTEGGCGYDCQPAPYCGDGTRNGPEQCDLGAAENTGDYGTCNMDCSFAPYCGDGTRQGPEDCDDGLGGSLSCSPTCKRRVVVQ